MTQPIEIDFYGKNLSSDQTQDVSLRFNQQILTSPDAPIILDLGQNQLNNESILSLEHILKDPRLVELRLDNNQLQGDAIIHLCQFLSQRRTPLQALSLSGNQLQLQDAQALAQWIVHNNGLIYLNLSDCQLSPQIVTILAKAVAQNACLTKLILSQNNVGTAVTDIAQMLQHNSCLEALYLCQCELPLEESKALGIAVAYHPTLREFNIESNDLPPSIATVFLEDIIFNNVLTDYMGPDVNNEIRNICNRNKTIPCTTPWSAEYNPLANLQQRMASLVVNTQPTSEATLTFLVAQNVIRSKKLSPETLGAPLSTNILDATYTEACKSKPKSQ